MWKFHNFSITQILREINVEDFSSAKLAILTHLEPLNFDFYGFLHFLKAKIYQKTKPRALEIAKNSSFRNPRFSERNFKKKINYRKS